MEVNNFELIKSYMDFGKDNEYFYNIQILQRAKDNKGIGSSNRLIKSYVIRSKDYLDKVKEEIIILCKTFNARAYIHFTRRNYLDIALTMMENLASQIRINNVSHTNRIYNTACGNSYDNKNKTWVIDIDKEELELRNEIKKAITECKPYGDKIIVEVPTKSGIHLITKPFDLMTFKKDFSAIDVHKNNPTILYVTD